MPVFHDRINRRIYYETHGSRGHAQEDVILIHGMASATAIWNGQIKALQPHFCVHSLDLPGHGRSDHCGPYSINSFADVLEDFMAHLKLETAHLMALSVGTGVALTAAVRNPECAKSLVLSGPSGATTPYWQPLGWVKLMGISTYVAVLSLLCLVVGQSRTAYLVNRFGPQTNQYNPLLDKMESEVAPMVVPCIAYDNGYPPYIGKLAAVSAPTLIVRGSGDGFPCRYAEYIHAYVSGPCEWAEIQGAKHVVSLDQPDAFNLVVLEFLKRVDGESNGGLKPVSTGV